MVGIGYQYQLPVSVFSQYQLPIVLELVLLVVINTQQGVSSGHPDPPTSLAGQFCYQGTWVFAKILGSARPSPKNFGKSLTHPSAFGKSLTLPSEFDVFQILSKITISGQKQLVIGISNQLPI